MEKSPSERTRRDELDRVLQLPGREVEIGGRVAAEGEDVLDPRVAVALDDRRELGAGVRRAREVRHRGERGLAVDADDGVVGAARGVVPPAP